MAVRLRHWIHEYKENRNPGSNRRAHTRRVRRRIVIPRRGRSWKTCVLSRQFVFLTIAVAIGALLLAGCGSRTATLAEGPGIVVTPTAAVTTMTSDRAIPPADVSPQATVRAWMAALARGGSDAAWDLLTQPTKDGLGRAAFEQMLPGLTETWGSWAASDAVEVHAHAYAPGPSVDYFGIPYCVVTVVGTPAGEGSRDRRARSIVVGWRGGPNWRGASDYGIVIPPSKPTGAFRLLSPAADGESVSAGAAPRGSPDRFGAGTLVGRSECGERGDERRTKGLHSVDVRAETPPVTGRARSHRRMVPRERRLWTARSQRARGHDSGGLQRQIGAKGRA